MSMQQTTLDQASVEKWLQESENQSFTNSIVLKWVKEHPELHEELSLGTNNEESTTLKSQLPHQLCYKQKALPKKESTLQHTVSEPACSQTAQDETQNEAPEGKLRQLESLSASLVPTISSQVSTLSNDSGVDLLKSCDSLMNSGVLTEGLKKQTKSIIEEQDQAKLQKKIKQLEGLLELVVGLLDNLTNPQWVLSQILRNTKSLVVCLKCRFLLLEDQIEIPDASRRPASRSFVRAFEITKEHSTIKQLDGKTVDMRRLAGIDVANDVVKTGHLFIYNSTKDLLCFPLFGVDGQTIGVMQIFGDKLATLDLDFLELVGVVSGLAIDNSVCFSKLRKATRRLLCVSTKLETTQKKAIELSTDVESQSKESKHTKSIAVTPKAASTPKKPCAARELEVAPVKEGSTDKDTPTKEDSEPKTKEETTAPTKEEAESTSTPVKEIVVPMIIITPPDGEDTNAEVEKIKEEKNSPAKNEGTDPEITSSEEVSTSLDEITPTQGDAEPATSTTVPVEKQRRGGELKMKKKKGGKCCRVLKAPFKALKKLIRHRRA